MKKMRVLFTLLMMITTLSLVAQSENSLIAEYASADEVLVTKEGKSSSNFSLTINKDEYEVLLKKAEPFAPAIRLSGTPDKKQSDKYNMSLHFNHEAQIAEAHKMFLYFGFSGIKINNEEFTLDHLLNIKK
jgi:hypothetical protein